jgi:hypothetical protein
LPLALGVKYNVDVTAPFSHANLCECAESAATAIRHCREAVRVYYVG